MSSRFSVLSVLVALVALVACVGEITQPELVITPPPPAKEVILDLGTLSSPAESLAARPKHASAHDERDAFDYAPTLDELSPEIALEKSPLDRDLDHDLVYCYASGDDTFLARYAVDGTPRAARMGALRKAFTLPLWSMHRGDAFVVSLVREKVPPVVLRTTFDGTLPFVALGPKDDAVTCNVATPESVRRAVTKLSKRVDDELAYADRSKLDDVALGFADPLAGHTSAFVAAMDETSIAAFVGWAHPIVTAFEARIATLATAWRAARTQLFDQAYAATRGYEGRTKDNVKVRVHDIACKRGDRFTPIEGLGWMVARGVFTLGFSNAPTVPGCGFQMDFTNEGAADAAMKDVLLGLRLVTHDATWFVSIEQHSAPRGQKEQKPFAIAPRETLTYRVFAPVDPATLVSTEVLLITTDDAVRETARPIARIR